MSESWNLKVNEGRTLLLLGQVLVFVLERISALQSQVSSQCVETWRSAGATWVMRDRDRNARLGGQDGEMGLKVWSGCGIAEAYAGTSDKCQITTAKRL